eukprot:TRINITY_DN7065_c0_g1_i1.p1 TRINITY_DN7065_c0_g1~~TRINITY_DN7065_c0_g1_i1.p1  ORF type:complete len:780 (-),score=202.56 TRINITY_DN7065_c0_g1_i1:166-2505(-)
MFDSLTDIGSNVGFALGIYWVFAASITSYFSFIPFLILVLFCAASPLWFICKPWATLKALNRKSKIRMAAQGLFEMAGVLCLVFGLHLCGPIRTAILYSFEVFVAQVIRKFKEDKSTPALNTSVHSDGSESISLGLAVLCVGVVTIAPHGDPTCHSFFPNAFGCILILVSASCSIIVRTLTKRSTRLQFPNTSEKTENVQFCLRMTAALIAVLPLWLVGTLESMIEWVFGIAPKSDGSGSFWFTVMAGIFFGFFGILVPFYVKSVQGEEQGGSGGRNNNSSGGSGSNKDKLNRQVPFAVILITILTCIGINGTMLDTLHFPMVLAIILAICAHMSRPTDSSSEITSSSSSGGNYSNLSVSLAPKRTKEGIIITCKKVIRHIMESSDSRRILLFLILNFAFMFVEILVGLATNSLGLLSDAGHMFFDCASLFIGLVASYVSKWKPDATMSFGYGRCEVLAGFINSIFLVFVALSISMEGLHRLTSTTEINGDNLLLVSIGGLLVNLVGLFFFHDAMEGHSDDDHDHEDGNENIQGLFLHVLADTLGSVGVIVSSGLLQFWGIVWADAVASLFVSVLIVLSVVPLLKTTLQDLMCSCPSNKMEKIQFGIQRIEHLTGVVKTNKAHFWRHSHSQLIGLLEVEIASPKNNNSNGVDSEANSTINNKAVSSSLSINDASSTTSSVIAFESSNDNFVQELLREIHSLLRECGVSNSTVEIRYSSSKSSISTNDTNSTVNMDDSKDNNINNNNNNNNNNNIHTPEAITPGSAVTSSTGISNVSALV